MSTLPVLEGHFIYQVPDGPETFDFTCNVSLVTTVPTYGAVISNPRSRVPPLLPSTITRMDGPGRHPLA